MFWNISSNKYLISALKTINIDFGNNQQTSEKVFQNSLLKLIQITVYNESFFLHYVANRLALHQTNVDNLYLIPMWAFGHYTSQPQS